MTGDTIAAFMLSGVAVVSAIGSVLLLSYRVGHLAGTIDGRIGEGERDRKALWAVTNKIADRFEHHLDGHRGTTP